MQVLLQINRKHLLYDGQLGLSSYDLKIDENGNVVQTLPSSLRYKTKLKEVPIDRYIKLLDMPAYFL